MSLKATGLERFEVTQALTLSYRAVVDELQAGRKMSHWMWFVFPQLRQLGRSETAKLYGLARGRRCSLESSIASTAAGETR